MYTTVTVNQNGQIVIPAKIRKQFNIKPQQNIKIIPQKTGLFIEPFIEDRTEKQHLPFPKKRTSSFPSFTTSPGTENISESVDEILINDILSPLNTHASN